MEAKKYLNLRKKIAYGSGDMASNFCYSFVSAFTMIYLTDTVGMNARIIWNADYAEPWVLMEYQMCLQGISLIKHIIDWGRPAHGCCGLSSRLLWYRY